MAFNIWERWPWTSFQNLNLDWLMKSVKEAVTKADAAYENVGTFDARITSNTDAIEQLGIDLEAISRAARVTVNSNLEAYYQGSHITGSELVDMVRQHGDLPFVEYNGEVYMLDSISNAGDMRFSMGHTVDGFNELVIRHIMIPAASSNAAYSITNVSSGGSSSVFAVEISEQGGAYISDHTYAEIYSQMQAGRIPVLLVGLGSNPTTYEICGMGETGTRTVNGQSVACIRFSDPTWLISSSNNVGVWIIDANNNVDHIAANKQLATLDNITSMVNSGLTNALLKTAQTLTAAEQAQVQQNLGISGGGATNAVLYTAQTLTDQQKAQARDNIEADIMPLMLNVTENNGVFSVDKTAAEIREHMHNLELNFGLNEGVTIDSYQIIGSPPYHYIIFTVCDPVTSSVTYVKYQLRIYFAGYAPSTADDIVTVTQSVIQHNIGGGSLPDTTNAAAGDFLRLDSQKNVVWETVPAAENNSFGGVL